MGKKILSKTENIYGYNNKKKTKTQNRLDPKNAFKYENPMKRLAKTNIVTQSIEVAITNEKKRQFYRKIGTLMEVGDSENESGKSIKSENNQGKSLSKKSDQSKKYKTNAKKKEEKNKSVTLEEKRKRIEKYKNMKLGKKKDEKIKKEKKISKENSGNKLQESKTSSKTTTKKENQSFKEKQISESFIKKTGEKKKPKKIVTYLDRIKKSNRKIKKKKEPEITIYESNKSIKVKEESENKQTIQEKQIDPKTSNAVSQNIEIQSCKLKSNFHKIIFDTGSAKNFDIELKNQITADQNLNGSGMQSPSEESNDFISEYTSLQRNKFQNDLTNSQFSKQNSEKFKIEEIRNFHKKQKSSDQEYIKKISPQNKLKKFKTKNVKKKKETKLNSELINFELTKESKVKDSLNFEQFNNDIDLIINGIDTIILEKNKTKSKLNTSQFEYSKTNLQPQNTMISNLIQDDENIKTQSVKNKIKEARESLGIEGKSQDFKNYFSGFKNSKNKTKAHPFIDSKDNFTELRRSLEKYAANLDLIEEESILIQKKKERKLKMNEDTSDFEKIDFQISKPEKKLNLNYNLEDMEANSLSYSLTCLSPKLKNQKNLFNSSIDKLSVEKEAQIILKSMRSISKVNMSSRGNSPRQSSIDSMNDAHNTLHNKRKMFKGIKKQRNQIRHKKMKEENSLKNSEIFDLNINQDYQMIKCIQCKLYFPSSNLKGQKHICQK